MSSVNNIQNLIKPMVYKAVYDDYREDYDLVPYIEKFKIPDKVYGKTHKLVTRIWNSYALGGGSTGVMLTGISGTGKTLVGELLSNLAIEKGMPVLLVAGMEYGTTFINLLESLDNYVIFFDEFSKLAGLYTQDKMLTLFNDLNNRRKLYIITENGTADISPYILNRPGRIRYHIDYNKVPFDILEDYCNDNNITGKFREDLIEVYDSCKSFSFDHLRTLVIEHLRYPEDSLEYLLSILNLRALKVVEIMNILTVNKNGMPVPYTVNFLGVNNYVHFVNGKTTIEVTVMNQDGTSDKVILDNNNFVRMSVERSRSYNKFLRDTVKPPLTYNDGTYDIKGNSVTQQE